MHELSITQEILRYSLQEALRQGADKIRTIRLRLGPFSGIVPECIQMYLDLLSEGTIAQGAKIEAVIHNARCFQKIRDEYGSFSKYIWGFTNGKTYLYTGHQRGEVPARNGLSDRVSKELKKRGMKYMGSITVYSHLQACGIINDHQESCFRYPQLLEITDAVRKRRDKE